jgi:hypothetical protein
MREGDEREGDDLKFAQIAVTGDGLYGLTGHGDVWRFDTASKLRRPFPMASRVAAEASARSR